MHTFSVEDGDAATMSSTAQKNRFASSWFALRLAGMLLIGLVLGAVVAAASHFSFANAMAGNRDDGMRPFTEPSPATASTTLAPVLGDGTAVEWWFAFKPTTAAFPRCSRNLSCMFGGEAMAFENPPRFGLQYILASRGLDGTTQPLQLHSDCIGNGEDPLAKTFQQIYSGAASNYVLWNDQFYDDPVPDIDPPCVKYCAKPWGHSKGFMAWQEDGTGFVVQVTTPDWPGSGGSQYPRKEQGNTLGCCEDDNVMVAQHFFALRLNSANDTLAVLQALHRASVVTDTKNPQLVKLTSGPSDLKQAASQLGQQVLDILEPFQGDISARNKASKVHLIAKPSGLQVPPWHLVSSLLETPLRTATWWTKPAINSTHEGYHPGCWHESLKPSTPEVQVGLSGRWQNTTFSFLGVPKTDGNDAKLGHSLSGRKLAIMSDMNQQGALDPDNPTGSCDLSQNSRGGLFFVVEDPVFHAGLVDLMTGETAAYVNGKSGCGGAGILWTNCKRSDCRYVKKADIALCNVTQWGCYNATQLPQDCPTDDVNELEVVGISTPAARTV